MNILFLTLLDFSSFSERNIYCDLLREFRRNGHNVYCISPTEKRNGFVTHFVEDNHLLKLRIGNTQKTNVIEKGISTVRIESQFISAIKKHFANITFDLVIYSTPPITLYKAVSYVKKRDNAKTYLLLKDIFPQNAVDLGMMKKSGLSAFVYNYFRRREKKLYAISDYIGCMSEANVRYLLSHNPKLNPDLVEICPNSFEIEGLRISGDERTHMRQKYNIPLNKKILVFGGNLGKPQDIEFFIDCIKEAHNIDDVYFLIVGDGTEYNRLSRFLNTENYSNVRLMKILPKSDFDRMIASCDIGLIFLDHRFTIPNFPSRLLSYMQAGLPILACTDSVSDVGKVISEGGFGWWCESNSPKSFSALVSNALDDKLSEMGATAFEYFNKHYSSEVTYNVIMSHFND